MRLHTRCLDCAFATWKLAANGRLHPSGNGICNWTKTLGLPAAMQDHDRERLKRLLTGPRQIWRTEPVTKCDTFQPKANPSRSSLEERGEQAAIPTVEKTDA